MSGKDKPAPSPIKKEEAESLGLGNITISDEVIAALAVQAAQKVEGVFLVGSSLKSFLGVKDADKGISVRTDEESGHASVDVDISVSYGVNIYEAAAELQRVVKEEVEALTGSMVVDKVNVRIRSIVMGGEPDRELVSPDKAMGSVASKSD
ncbi:Asp23/Gls24 family envelope stress response protein [Candidatus Sumerlaeota bacterium]|nr:Asp23/Gls24 family envelope stress response protein [Candidatus Sumerlaeota bacterium]